MCGVGRVCTAPVRRKVSHKTSFFAEFRAASPFILSFSMHVTTVRLFSLFCIIVTRVLILLRRAGFWDRLYGTSIRPYHFWSKNMFGHAKQFVHYYLVLIRTRTL